MVPKTLASFVWWMVKADQTLWAVLHGFWNCSFLENPSKSLYHLVEHCAYDDLPLEIIRGLLVVSISDHTVSDRLCTDAELTLKKPKTIVRTWEAVQEHCSMLQQHSKGKVDQIRKSKKVLQWKKRHSQPIEYAKSLQLHLRHSQPQKSANTGKKTHYQDHCPTKDAECYKCSHFSSQCLQNYNWHTSNNWNQRHRVQSLPDIPYDTQVWLNVQGNYNQVSGSVVATSDTPRSYMANTQTRCVRAIELT